MEDEGFKRCRFWVLVLKNKMKFEKFSVGDLNESGQVNVHLNISDPRKLTQVALVFFNHGGKWLKYSKTRMLTHI